MPYGFLRIRNNIISCYTLYLPVYIIYFIINRGVNQGISKVVHVSLCCAMLQVFVVCAPRNGIIYIETRLPRMVFDGKGHTR